LIYPPFDGQGVPSAYCGECGWQYRTEGDDAAALSRAMIDHFVETGHSPVERRDATDRSPADGPLEPSERTATRTRDRWPSRLAASLNQSASGHHWRNFTQCDRLSTSARQHHLL